MTAFDLFVIIPLIWGVYKGFTKGLIMEVATLLALFLGVFFAVKFSDSMEAFLNISFSIDPQYLPIVAFTMIFVLVVFAIIITAKLVERFVEAVALTPVNKIGGSLLGLLKYSLGISVIIFLLNCAGKDGRFFSEETRTKSVLYKPLEKISTAILPMDDIKEKVMQKGRSIQAAGASSATNPGQP